jgi:hypothetical protein
MPKRFSDDIDLVSHSPGKKPAPGTPPSSWPLPKFEPFTISKEGTRYGIPNRPDGVNAESTTGIIKLFFTSKVVDKLVEHIKILWGTLYSKVSENQKVMQFAWKDADIVLFMSNFHDGTHTTLRFRPRPVVTASGAAQTN